MKRTIAVLAFGFAYAYASACAGVAQLSQYVKFGDQSNIIVWNPETKTEHFIRNAYFDSQAKDFGFIAATPSVPELKEGSQKAFDSLAILEPPPSPFSCGREPKSAIGSWTLTADANVEVIQQVSVGKYLATTVRSDEPTAMSRYLKANGYSTSSDIDEWIAFYTKKKWVFTAFKVRKVSKGRSETGIVRMSFKTDEPFNPYYVPRGNMGEDRSSGTLQIYFVSDGTYSSTVGHGKSWIPAAWNNQIEDILMHGMKDTPLHSLAVNIGIPESEFPKNPTVTYFEKQGWLDGSKDDLYFKKDSSSPILVIVGILALGGVIWRFSRSRTARLLRA